MKKLYIIVLAAVVFLASCTGQTELPETAEAVVKPETTGAATVENERFVLEVSETGYVKVSDKTNGNVYTSTPEAADEDEIAQGVNKNRLKSEYYVTLVNSGGGTAELNSFEASVSKDGVSVEKTDEGIKVWYLYPDQNVMHSAEYTLDSDGLNVTVSFKDMTEQFGKISGDDWGFMSVSVMPYFVASGSESNGYMVVPDGSGAIINHNNKKSSYAVYAQEIYGRDPALSLENKTLDPKTARIPVFGSLEGGKGYTAIITDGAAEATIYAETSGANSSYNNVYAGIAVRRSDGVSQTVSNGYGGSSTLGRTAVSAYVPEDGKISVKYMLLGGENLSYVNLAKAYRKYLTDSGVAPKVENAPLYLSFTGGVSDTEYTLGIPHKTVVPVTTFERAAEIVSDLKQNGVNDIAVRYTGWQKGGADTKIPKSSKTEKKLGGDKAFKTLTETGAYVFPELDLVNFYKSGNGYNLQSDCAFSLSGSAAYVYQYEVNTGEKTDDVPSRLLSPLKTAEAMSNFKNGFENLSLGAMGSTVFSEFSVKNPVRRSETAGIYGDIISGAGERVMVNGGNSYAIAGASHIFSMDSESTGYDLEDGSIPFYQIALHGLRSYSVPPINLTADANRAMLKALETGSSLCYSVCGGDIEDMSEEITDAPYDYIRETIIEQSGAAMPVLEAVSEKEIVNHEKLGEDLYKTTFEGGAAVYVNYSAKAAYTDGKTVAAESFLYEEGAE
ncbi:MAG: DUF5696 domain-containing protein [Clostridia bacterium]